MNGDMIVNNEEGRLEPEEKYMVAKCDIDNIRSLVLPIYERLKPIFQLKSWSFTLVTITKYNIFQWKLPP